ncbi:MAG: hypothetical protein KBF97_07350, partial [Bacteroidetes bacterium]|nr:hypothetical protein [Bacteroidota bacterium]
PMWKDQEKLAKEKEVLGFYVSGHPLLKYEKEINAFATVHLGDVEGMKSGTVKAGGIISSIKKKIDKKGNTMAFITIEDFTGKAECVVFSSVYKKNADLLVDENMVLVEGKGEVSGDIIKILVDEVLPMEAVREKFAKKIFFLLNADEVTDITLGSLRQLMEKNKGNCACYFNVVGKEFDKQHIFISRKFSINPTTEFIDGVQELLGKHAIKLS